MWLALISLAPHFIYIFIIFISCCITIFVKFIISPPLFKDFILKAYKYSVTYITIKVPDFLFSRALHFFLVLYYYLILRNILAQKIEFKEFIIVSLYICIFIKNTSNLKTLFSKMNKYIYIGNYKYVKLSPKYINFE